MSQNGCRATLGRKLSKFDAFRASKLKETLLMFCATLFIFTSSSSALLGTVATCHIQYTFLNSYGVFFFTKYKKYSESAIFVDTKMATNGYQSRKALILRELIKAWYLRSMA